MADGSPAFHPETVPLADLTPHPKNYRNHSEMQLAHLVESLVEHGVYRNVVAARDGTILAGHGVVLAAQQLGLESLPILRLDVDPDDPKALKVLTGDNEIARLAEVNDRALTELLKDIKDVDLVGLLGTGFDEQMLAALAMVTRPASELASFNEAAEWVGMPEFEPTPEPIKVVVSFRCEEDRQEFARKLGLTFNEPFAKTITTWWPYKERDDRQSLMFEG